MRKLSKVLGIACAAVLLAASFAGCGSSTDTKSDASAQVSTQQETTKAPEAGKRVTMRFAWWGGDARHKATLDAIATYKQKNPNITIEGEYGGYDGYQQKLMTQLAGGQAPDLIQIDPIWNSQLGAKKEAFVDLSKEKAIDMTQFDQKVIQGFSTVNGVVIGLPMGINGFGVQINKAFMQKYNLPLDKAWTWEDIIDEGKKIHDKDKDSYLIAIHPTGLQVLFISDYLRGKTGKYWINDDYTIAVSKDDLVDMYKTMKSLFDSGAAAPFGEVALVDAKIYTYPKYINGQVGMIEDWSGMVSSYKPVVKADNFAVGPAITVKGGVDQTTTYKPSMLLAISAKSLNVQEALKFANWMLNDKDAAMVLKDQRSIPASNSSRQALMDANILDKDIVQMVNDTLKNPAAPVPLIENNSEIAEITKDVNSKVIFGKLTPEQGADELNKRITDKFNTLKTAAK